MSDEQNNAATESQSSSASGNPVRARILAAMEDKTLAVGNFADLCGKDGIEIPGLGKASVDVANKQIKVDKIMQINKETVDALIAGGL